MKMLSMRIRLRPQFMSPLKNRIQHLLLAMMLAMISATPAITQGLLTPRNPVATDAGTWGQGSKIDELVFLNQPGMWPNFYDDCAGVEIFHVQHVVRLKNKNGRAYFVVAQSRAHNGYISILETDPGVLDPVTDLIVPKGGSVGKYIWQDVYTGPFNGTINPVGNFNHPGKMDVAGDVLIVAAQNWDESNPFCNYAPGVTSDRVLFYDVSDPKQPSYMGAVLAGQLQVPEISSVGLVRTPNGDYLLNAGGNGTYRTMWARSISPNFINWNPSPTGYFVGQDGMMFSSYQEVTTGVAPSGTERLMYFESKDRNTLKFTEYAYDALTHALTAKLEQTYPYDLPGANRDWDSDSLYVSASGVPIIYSFKSQRGDNGVMYQLSLPMNPADGSRLGLADGRIYLVLGGQLRHVPNMETFNSLFKDSTSVIRIASTSTYRVGLPITDGAYLAKMPVDPKVFLVIDGTKRWIYGGAVDQYGFNLNKIQTLTAAQLAAIPDGPPILEEGRLVGLADGKIYLVIDWALRHVPNMETYNKLFNGATPVVRIASTSPYQIGPPLTDGAYLAKRPIDPKVFLVVDGTKRWIREGFDRYGFNWSKIQTLTAAQLAAIPDGADIK
jgi:hypothetical protein